ncbi:MAG TPA: NPCBM/NEW2 domain-containing protein, partial [Sedimentisphaerales bacterium]|nr:NPCBM/NEW2 domain-containing protein [Sedimentisphaerales bacterium]
MARISLDTVLCVSLFLATLARAVEPQPQEFELRDRWLAPLLGKSLSAPVPHLELLYQDTTDGISRGQSWRGTPFQLGQKTYTHGLAFNSTKHLLVIVGRPAERFTADVGLENNDDTQRGAAMGNGSVTCHVLVDGKEVLTTPVLRLKDGPRPIDIPLNGARQFEIRVKD